MPWARLLGEIWVGIMKKKENQMGIHLLTREGIVMSDSVRQKIERALHKHLSDELGFGISGVRFQTAENNSHLLDSATNDFMIIISHIIVDLVGDGLQMESDRVRDEENVHLTLFLSGKKFDGSDLKRNVVHADTNITFRCDGTLSFSLEELMQMIKPEQKEVN